MKYLQLLLPLVILAMFSSTALAQDAEKKSGEIKVAEVPTYHELPEYEENNELNMNAEAASNMNQIAHLTSERFQSQFLTRLEIQTGNLDELKVYLFDLEFDDEAGMDPENAEQLNSGITFVETDSGGSSFGFSGGGNCGTGF
ncbi:MAG: hypothetical protein R3211_00145 [Balneolaceae bacterium]|nr:hypothetical protein [Balneolaceae bacterium]